MLEAKQKVPRVDAHYNSRKEWRPDAKGYFLVKVFYAKGVIGVRHMNYRHEPLGDIYGTDGYAIVQTAVKQGLVGTLQHAAYLGHELMKAEIALKNKLVYVQDEPLDLKKKTKRKESNNSKA